MSDRSRMIGRHTTLENRKAQDLNIGQNTFLRADFYINNKTRALLKGALVLLFFYLNDFHVGLGDREIRSCRRDLSAIVEGFFDFACQGLDQRAEFGCFRFCPENDRILFNLHRSDRLMRPEGVDVSLLGHL